MAERSNPDVAPIPDVMPIDVESWRQQVGLCNFVNAYYVQRDVGEHVHSGSVLVIGPGQGLEPLILQWRNHKVTTFDIDARFSPDVIGSVHDMRMFAPAQFDAVVASHVLEHLPPAYLDAALAEIARVGRYAVVYLPYHGRYVSVRLRAALRELDWSWIVNLINPFERPDPSRPRYMQGQHYWEVGLPGFRRGDIHRRFSRHFDLLRCYRNVDWLPSYNLVMRSRLHDPAASGAAADFAARHSGGSDGRA